MDDLTSAERRLVLGAMWRFRDSTAADLRAAGDGSAEDVAHEQEFVETMDAAARKLGGDPGENLYGAPRY